jgi:hypothetical protein
VLLTIVAALQERAAGGAYPPPNLPHAVGEERTAQRASFGCPSQPPPRRGGGENSATRLLRMPLPTSPTAWGR